MIYISSNNLARKDDILSADLKIMEEWANQGLVTFSPSKSCDMTLAFYPLGQISYHFVYKSETLYRV